MKKATLENLVKEDARRGHVHHIDPLQAISHHLVFLVFIGLAFLLMLFVYFIAPATPESATSFVIYEFEPITVHKEIAGAVFDFIFKVRHSEDRPLVLLALYTFWIVIFGLINMVLYERNLKK